MYASTGINNNGVVEGNKTMAKWGLGGVTTSDEKYEDEVVHVDGYKFINFNTCSYLGLHLNPEVMASAKEAIDRYGILLSSSRSYTSNTLFTEAEQLLYKITGGYAFITSSTTIANATYFSAMVGHGDVIVINPAVHASIQHALPVSEKRGARIMVLPRHIANSHHGIKRLVQELCMDDKVLRVVYAVDGIYSMTGNGEDISLVRDLLSLSPKVNIFVDDAHGAGVYGARGEGWALSQIEMQPRLVVALSFSKAYGAGGAALIFDNEQTVKDLLITPAPTMYSIQLSVPQLGALIASCKILLNDHYMDILTTLRDNIEYFREQCKTLKLNLITATTFSPVHYIALGDQPTAAALALALHKGGLKIGMVNYPVVPKNMCGLRITISALHTKDQILSLALSICQHSTKSKL